MPPPNLPPTWETPLGRRTAAQLFLSRTIGDANLRKNVVLNPGYAREMFQRYGRVTIPPDVTILCVGPTEGDVKKIIVFKLPQYSSDVTLGDLGRFWLTGSLDGNDAKTAALNFLEAMVSDYATRAQIIANPSFAREVFQRYLLPFGIVLDPEVAVWCVDYPIPSLNRLVVLKLPETSESIANETQSLDFWLAAWPPYDDLLVLEAMKHGLKLVGFSPLALI